MRTVTLIGQVSLKLMMSTTWKVLDKFGLYFHIIGHDSNTVPCQQSHILLWQRTCVSNYSAVSFSTSMHHNETLHLKQLHFHSIGHLTEMKYLILVTMIHWCEQNLTKITVLYSFPISETMLLSIKIELRTTNKRVMNINLFYFSSCIPLSKNWRIMCCSSIYHHDSTYSLSHRKQVLI